MGCLITGTIAYFIIAIRLCVKFSVKFGVMLLTTPVGTFVGSIIAAYALVHGDMHYFQDSLALIGVSLVGTLVRRRLMSKPGVKVKKKPSLGEHVFLKTKAAVKVLHTQVAENALDNFLREAQTIAHLEHPNIVHVLEFGIEHGCPFLVMNYAPNGTLRQRHQSRSQLPLPTIVSYIRQVAAVLQYAHARRVIHRDIKPENMLVGLKDEIILSDFGIAIISDSTFSQSTQNQAGTPIYMAPEQNEEGLPERHSRL